MEEQQSGSEGRSSPIALPPLLTDALARLRFGDIRLTIHEGRLVQIDVTEKTRLTAPTPRPE